MKLEYIGGTQFCKTCTERTGTPTYYSDAWDKCPTCADVLIDDPQGQEAKKGDYLSEGKLVAFTPNELLMVARALRILHEGRVTISDKEFAAESREMLDRLRKQLNEILSKI